MQAYRKSNKRRGELRGRGVRGEGKACMPTLSRDITYNLLSPVSWRQWREPGNKGGIWSPTCTSKASTILRCSKTWTFCLVTPPKKIYLNPRARFFKECQQKKAWRIKCNKVVWWTHHCLKIRWMFIVPHMEM